MPRYLETPSKKLHIIRTAIRLFTTYGFHTAGVDLIAKESNVPKATLYNYFRSKGGLIEICLLLPKRHTHGKSKRGDRNNPIFHLNR